MGGRENAGLSYKTPYTSWDVERSGWNREVSCIKSLPMVLRLGVDSGLVVRGFCDGKHN